MGDEEFIVLWAGVTSPERIPGGDPSRSIYMGGIMG